MSKIMLVFVLTFRFLPCTEGNVSLFRRDVQVKSVLLLTFKVFKFEKSTATAFAESDHNKEDRE
jgi:hypothetical protein